MKKNDRPAAFQLWQVRAVLAEGEICASVGTRKGNRRSVHKPTLVILTSWMVELVPPDDRDDEAGHTSSFDYNNPVIYTDGSAWDVSRDGGAGFVVIPKVM